MMARHLWQECDVDHVDVVEEELVKVNAKVSSGGKSIPLIKFFLIDTQESSRDTCMTRTWQSLMWVRCSPTLEMIVRSVCVGHSGDSDDDGDDGVDDDG